MTRQSSQGRLFASLPPLVAPAGALTVAGQRRTYLAVKPAHLARRAPLLLVFHGSNQTGAKVRAFSGRTFDALAAREGLVVVYADGYKGHWNDARAASNFAARREHYDDVAFARALVEHFAASDDIDAGRVYAAGYSNGGQMVIRLVHETPELFAGAAIIAATQPSPENFIAYPAQSKDRPVPVLLINGTRDPLVPYVGGMASLWGFRPRGLGLSAPQTAAYFAVRNGITTPPQPQRIAVASASAKTAVAVSDFRERGKRPVRAITITGGGHVIPNPWFTPSRIMGATNHDLDTGTALWDFFTAADVP